MKKVWVLFAPLLPFFVQPAAAEVTLCNEVTSVPFKITMSGIWCLKNDFKYKKSKNEAIKIAADDVVLDLNGHTITGKGGPSQTASGIYANGRYNVTIRNGTVAGFERGVYVDDGAGDGSGVLVEAIRAVGNYFAGIQVKGEDVIVRDNQVLRTGDGEDITVYGIFVNSARGVDVYGNTVTHTSTSNSARGIGVVSGTEVFVINNEITDLRTATSRYGVYVSSSNTVSVSGNEITSVGSTTGIRSTGTTDTLCFNNVIFGFSNTHSTCDFESGTLP